MAQRKDPPCPNLKALYGKRYRVEYEESYYAQYGAKARVEDPWLMIIPCKHGHICPWTETKLAACSNTEWATGRLMRSPNVEVCQSGADGVNALFELKHFKEVAKIMKPMTVRKLSAEQKAACAKRLADYRYQGSREGGVLENGGQVDEMVTGGR